MEKVKDFVAIDFQYRQKAEYPCSVGMVKVRNGEEVDRFHSLINIADAPNEGYKAYSEERNGISTEQTLDSPTFPEIFPQIETFIEGLPLIAHYAQNERFVFIKALDRFGLTSYLSEAKFIDTKRMCGLTMNECVEKYNLTYNTEYLSLNEAKATSELYLLLDAEDVWYPAEKEKKRKDLTQGKMAAIKGKERLSASVFEEFDIEQAEFKENPYFGKRFYLSGELSMFRSKDEMCMLMKEKLGAIPVDKFTKSGTDAIVGGGQTGVSSSRLPNAQKWGLIIVQEEEVFSLLKGLGVDVPSRD